jgi:hypothetical protein
MTPFENFRTIGIEMVEVVAPEQLDDE